MRSRPTARLISLAALLPLLVVAVTGLGYDRLRCTFTGQVSESGCCPAEDAPSVAVANGASCCDHESARTVRLPSECPQDSVVAAPAPTLLPRPMAPSPPKSSTLAACVRVLPPRLPSTLRALQQSFLI